MVENKHSFLVAEAIRKALSDLSSGIETHFVDIATELNPDLYIPSKITDESANAAWNFADQYFDARWHGFKTMNDLTWEEADEIIRRIVDQLEAGDPITDSKVLNYRYP